VENGEQKQPKNSAFWDLLKVRSQQSKMAKTPQRLGLSGVLKKVREWFSHITNGGAGGI
jgi:hypothetical protein